MNSKNEILALGPYLEAVTAACQGMSKDELCSWILRRAEAIPARERKEFLAQMNVPPPPTLAKQKPRLEEILSEIANVKESIEELHESISDGTYYDEYGDGYGEDHFEYGDEPALLDEHKESFLSLLAEAGEYFIKGDMPSASRLYGALLEIVDSSEYAITSELSEVCWREVQARYCRSIYESSTPKERVANLMGPMLIQDRLVYWDIDSEQSRMPCLRDIQEAFPSSPPDWASFLKAWPQVLRSIDGDRACLLSIEACHMIEGLEGAALETRRRRKPIGFLYWLDLLLEASEWQQAALAAEEALNFIQDGMLRAMAAEKLATAGAHLGDSSLQMKGLRERFCAQPTIESLGALISYAKSQNTYEQELETCLECLKQEKDLLEWQIRLLLLLRRLEDARNRAKPFKALGWESDSRPGAILFSSILATLCRGDKRARTVDILLQRYWLGAGWESAIPAAENTGGTRGTVQLLEELYRRTAQHPLSEIDLKGWESWARKTAEARAQAILDARHRGAYCRAAEAVGGFLEYLILSGKPAEARDMVRELVRIKFNRLSAFKHELSSILSKSSLLRDQHLLP